MNQIIKEVKTEIKKKGQNIQKHRLEILNVLKFKASINQSYFQFVCGRMCTELITYLKRRSPITLRPKV